MCFEYTALPPEIPVHLLASTSAPSSAGESLVLTSQDGTQFAAYLARAGSPSGAGIVILPDVRGLYRFYAALADRFAAAGIDAITIDYFGRTAGPSERDENFDFMPHVMQTTVETVSQDVRAAVTRLRSLDNAPRAICTVGFCFGGTMSFHQAAEGHGLSGVIGFYGMPLGSERMKLPAPIERIKSFECPVLGLFGGADQGIPAEAVQAFDAALTEGGIEHEIVIYPDAPHSFFDRRAEEYKNESADSWQRMLSFVKTHTPQARA